MDDPKPSKDKAKEEVVEAAQEMEGKDASKKADAATEEPAAATEAKKDEEPAAAEEAPVSQEEEPAPKDEEKEAPKTEPVAPPEIKLVLAAEDEEPVEIELPTRRRRASDDEEGDDFHDAKSEGESKCRSPRAGVSRWPRSSPHRIACLCCAGDESEQSGSEKPAGAVSKAKKADWGDEVEAEEKEKSDVEEEEAAADDEDDKAEEGPGEEDEVEKAKPAPRQPFEVPTAGAFWLHDDRFDDADAAAHEA
jgi:hypothetical protein